MAKNKFCLLLMILLVICLGIGGYLFWEEYEQLENRAAELEKSLAESESKVETLNRKLAALEEELEPVKKRDIEENEPVEVEGLVQVRDLDETIKVDLRYATENNFTGSKLYPFSLCLLQKGTAEKLAAAQAEFKKDGYSLKVWDAYRPMSVQEKLWEKFPDGRYVAPPETGSNHNRGAAVDVTLVDEEGRELSMPTGFDEFVPEASRSYPDMPDEARENMEYLTKVMVNNGFTTIESEWWHFNDEDVEEYPLVDLDFEKFAEEYFSR